MRCAKLQEPMKEREEVTSIIHMCEHLSTRILAREESRKSRGYLENTCDANGESTRSQHPLSPQRRRRRRAMCLKDTRVYILAHIL